MRRAKRKEKFIRYLSQGWSATKCCEMLGIPRRALLRWRQNDSAFNQAWADALEAGIDRLEDKAVERAMDQSDTLLQFMLRARRPAKFRPELEIKAAPSNVTNNLQVNIAALDDEALKNLIEATGKVLRPAVAAISKAEGSSGAPLHGSGASDGEPGGDGRALPA